MEGIEVAKTTNGKVILFNIQLPTKLKILKGMITSRNGDSGDFAIPT